MTPALPIDDATLDAEIVRRSLAAFCRAAWPIVEPGTDLVWSWHLDAICAHLEAVTAGKIKQLVINIPPGHMKSLMVSVFWPAWEWLTYPPARTLFASHSGDVVLRDSTRTRQIIESDLYCSWVDTLAAYMPHGEWCLAKDQNAKSKFENTLRGFRQCVTVKGKVTGSRGDKIVVDDPVDVSQILGEPAKVKGRMDEVADWWDKVMSSRLNDKRTGARVIIMQRVHTDDLAGVVSQREGVVVLCLPTEYEPDHPYVWRKGKPYAWTPDPQKYPRIAEGDPRTEEGELLMPALFPVEVVDTIELVELGPTQYAGQHQQRPTPKEGNLFKRAWWMGGRGRYSGDAESIGTNADQVGIFVDCQFKKKADADPVGALVFARRGPRRYLLDRRHGAKGIIETIAMVRPLYRYWMEHSRSLVLVIEDKANGDAAIELLRQELGNVHAFDPTPHGDKWARAERVTWPCQAGDILVPESGSMVETVLEQWCGFPGMPHDEDVDCLSMMGIFWRHAGGQGAGLKTPIKTPAIMPTLDAW